MSTYLSYDLKGIQSFIFEIPRLRYVIGGSALIDWFDRDYAPRQGSATVKRIFSGGGKGCFGCADLSAGQLQVGLTAEAHRVGLDIRIARGPDFRAVISHTGQLFPCLPEGSQLDGHPCAASGNWPVALPTDVSHLADRRLYHRGERPLYRFTDDLIRDLSLPPALSGENIAFFRDVDAEGSGGEPSDSDADRAAGRAGAAALGNRNRWAVICMDGNDIGAQFAAAEGTLSEEQLIEWAEAFSDALDDCSRSAFRVGLARVLQRWVETPDFDMVKEQCRLSDGDDGERGAVVIPVRPLIVGGDDMKVLCHSAHAFEFVEAVTTAFADRSHMYADLWHGTSGELSISAGILFCGTSLPLSPAVAYAEQLLHMAKVRGRAHQHEERAAPACIDWEVVTESVIDTPWARRQRTVKFHDADIDQTIELTRKPYRMDDLANLRRPARRYAALPRGITHRLRDILGQSYWDRRLGVASLAKQQEALGKDLQESDDRSEAKGRWKVENGVRRTDVLDIVEMIEEELRLERPTVVTGG